MIEPKSSSTMDNSNRKYLSGGKELSLSNISQITNNTANTAINALNFNIEGININNNANTNINTNANTNKEIRNLSEVFKNQTYANNN